MNIYKRELVIRYKSTIFWSIGAVLLILSSFYKFAIADLGAMSSMVKYMPEVIKVMYGINDLDITTLGGYGGVTINMLNILIAFYGLFLGFSLLGREKKSGTIEFLFVKPIFKKKVLLLKILAGFTIIVGFIGFVGLVLTIAFISQGGINSVYIFRMFISIISNAIFFYSLGIILSIFYKKFNICIIVFFVIYLEAIFLRLMHIDLYMFNPIVVFSGDAVVNGQNYLLLLSFLLLSKLFIHIALKSVKTMEG